MWLHLVAALRDQAIRSDPRPDRAIGMGNRFDPVSDLCTYAARGRWRLGSTLSLRGTLTRVAGA